jgi:hypothetical protein
MKLKILFVILCLGVFSRCTETEGEKIVLPTAGITGEYVVVLELTQPFEAESEQHILIYNTANGFDSLWVEDHNFFESKVKVKWDGANSFSAEAGEDIFHGEVVNIAGQIFPEKDSIHVEWRYLQGGEPEDDYVVVANGVLHNGLTN